MRLSTVMHVVVHVGGVQVPNTNLHRACNVHGEVATVITWALSDAGLHVRRPHDEVTAGVDEHTMAWPLVQDDEFATPDHRVLPNLQE